MNKTIFILIALIAIGTVISAQSITLSSPNGGETWTLGSNRSVTWSFTGIAESTRVKLVLFKDRVDADHKVGNIVESISIGSGGRGSHNWKVGDYEGSTAALGGGYYIRVITMDGAQKDESNNPFSIGIGILGTAEAYSSPSSSTSSPWIRVATPLAPLTMSHSFRIGWNYSGVTHDLMINLITESGGIIAIATGVSPGAGGGIGHYNWIVGNMLHPTSILPVGAYRIEVSTGTGIRGETRAFQIHRPAIEVTEPHPGEELRRGHTKTIRWNAPDLRGRVHIEAWYNRSGLAMYQRLFSNVRNTGSRDWTIWPRPGAGGGEVDPPPTGNSVSWNIRVVSVDCPHLFAESGSFILN